MGDRYLSRETEYQSSFVGEPGYIRGAGGGNPFGRVNIHAGSGNHWMDGLRSFEDNAIWMTSQTHGEYYGYRNSDGTINTERRDELATQVGATYSGSQWASIPTNHLKNALQYGSVKITKNGLDLTTFAMSDQGGQLTEYSYDFQTSGGGSWVGDGFISSEGLGAVTWEEAGMGVLNFFNPFHEPEDNGVIYATMPDLPIGPGGAVKIVKRAKNVKKIIVIGEDMKNKVIPYAQKIGAKWFKPRGTNSANWMRNQTQWIRRQLNEPGTTIIDIGPKGTTPTSKYYMKELEEIFKWLGG